MLDHYIKKPCFKKRMLSSPAGIIFENYILYLHQKGYRRSTIQVYCQVLEHFGRFNSHSSVARA